MAAETSLPSHLGTRVELRVNCEHLLDLDRNSLSDPFVVLYVKEGRGQYAAYDRTETVQENNDPHFAKAFVLNYYFEKSITLKFEVYDQDGPVRNITSDLRNHDFLGWGESDLGELVHAPGQTMTIALKNKKGGKQKNAQGRLSLITFNVEEVSTNQDVCRLTLHAVDLPKMDWFGSADPFFELYKMREDGTWVCVFRSEVIKNTYKPKWPMVTKSLAELTNGDVARPVKIKVFDWDKNSAADLIGECETSVEEMMGGGLTKTLTDPTSTKKKKKKRGTLKVMRCEIEKRYSFLDYLGGGVDMQLLVAIDFTGSNGHHLDAGTLHYRNPQTGMSQYSDAIIQIGTILDSYDVDHQYPVWGFGAMLNGRVDHCFPLTMNPHAIEVVGVNGILGVYNQALDSGMLQFSGPTLFHHILNNAVEIARQPQAGASLNYYVLLILTDGVINDMAQTIDAVIAGSNLPLSVIIVGIGNANFDAMDRLDGDGNTLMNDRGQRCERDIVQFVPMRQFSSNSNMALAEHTLKEIPGQFLDYMRKNQIEPLPKTQAVASDVIEQQLLRQQTVYNNPPPPAATMQPAPLPPNWEMIVDPAGTPYYVNHVTQQTQWDRPMA